MTSVLDASLSNETLNGERAGSNAFSTTNSAKENMEHLLFIIAKYNVFVV